MDIGYSLNTSQATTSSSHPCTYQQGRGVVCHMLHTSHWRSLHTRCCTSRRWWDNKDNQHRSLLKFQYSLGYTALFGMMCKWDSSPGWYQSIQNCMSLHCMKGMKCKSLHWFHCIPSCIVLLSTHR